jgi:hypothetical protein
MVQYTVTPTVRSHEVLAMLQPRARPHTQFPPRHPRQTLKEIENFLLGA